MHIKNTLKIHKIYGNTVHSELLTIADRLIQYHDTVDKGFETYITIPKGVYICNKCDVRSFWKWIQFSK